MPSRVTSTLSWKKLRRLVDRSRTILSKMISSIGRRSYETTPESTMARMPPAPVADSSCREKPTIWSISSCDRMRSAPARSPDSSPEPSSIMVAHSAAMSLAFVDAPCSASAAPHSSASEASPLSAAALAAPVFCSARAAAQSSSRAGSSGCATGFCLLNDDVLEQHRVDLRRIDGDVDPAQQFLAQTVDAGRAFEVARAELAHEDLEGVLDARQQRLDLGDELLVLDLEGGAELEHLRALLVRLVREVDHHLADVDEGDGLHRLLRLGRLAAAVPVEPVPAAAERTQRDEARGAEDQRLLRAPLGL